MLRYVWSGGQSTPGETATPLIVGLWTSLTVMGKLHVVVAPLWRVAVQTSVVVPSGKTELDGGTQASVPQEPVTPGNGKVTAAWQTLGSVPTVIGAGQASEQAWVQQTGSAVWKLSRQPPAMLPTSPPASSNT